MKKMFIFIMLFFLCFGFYSCDQNDSHTHTFVDGICSCGEKDPSITAYDKLKEYILSDGIKVVEGYYSINQVESNVFLDFLYIVEKEIIEIYYANNVGPAKYSVKIWIDPSLDGDYEYYYLIEGKYVSGKLKAATFNSETILSHTSSSETNLLDSVKELAVMGIDILLSRFNSFTNSKAIDVKASDLGFNNYE